jgi:hypothetical protein
LITIKVFWKPIGQFIKSFWPTTNVFGGINSIDTGGWDPAKMLEPTQASHIYIEQDFTCPISRNGDQMIWRRGGSDDVIPDVETFISISMDRVAGAKQQVRLSGTAGVNAIIRNGRYRQECRFVYRNGQFKCEKP